MRSRACEVTCKSGVSRTDLVSVSRDSTHSPLHFNPIHHNYLSYYISRLIAILLPSSLAESI